MIISLEELGLAYRKAKVDLYYSSHVSLEAIASYEESLHTNLTVLQEKIQGDDESWVEENEFTGNWFLATKSIDMSCWELWTDPTTVDKFCPHDEACSKASGLTPPR